MTSGEKPLVQASSTHLTFLNLPRPVAAPFLRAWWNRVLPSPDRGMLLAEWNASCDLMIEMIREAPITLLADVIYDERESRRPPLDFYKDALDWLLLRFRNFVTDIVPVPPGPHVVVLDQPSPAPPARPTPDPRFAWLASRETIWYRVYQRAYECGWQFSWAQHKNVHSLKLDGFYPSAVISHAKFDPLLEIADAVVGLAFDFAFWNIQRAEGDELPDIEWQDEQFMKVVRKYRAKPATGNILNWGFAVFPSSAPAFGPFTGWITRLCTDDGFASLRGD